MLNIKFKIIQINLIIVNINGIEKNRLDVEMSIRQVGIAHLRQTKFMRFGYSQSCQNKKCMFFPKVHLCQIYLGKHFTIRLG